MTTQPFKSLPNFELAPLQKFDRELFATSDLQLKKVHGFILALGLVFNDLKGITWFAQLLAEGKPLDASISAYRGQWGGINAQLQRYACGIVNELLQLIQKNKDCLDHRNFIRCRKTLKQKIRKSWDEIVECALQIRGKTKLRTLLFVIRDEAAFHYYGVDHFSNGYDSWLGANDQCAKFAYFSFGKNMESSRFYLSDAVSEKHVQGRLKKHRVSMTELLNLLQLVNEAIRFIVEIYVTKILKARRVLEQK